MATSERPTGGRPIYDGPIPGSHSEPPAPRTLRDELALERTRLANERTLLAYARTALMLVASGATLLKLGPAGTLDLALGWTAIAAGSALALTGGLRYRRAARPLR